MAIKRPVFEEYEEYMLDYDTSNISFISMASILRRKGINNHSFFLKLYDEDLVGVDPYDESLSLELKWKVIIECRRNFWYFIREVAQIPGVKGGFELQRGNLAGAWSCLNNINTFLVMPRQHGKTWLILCYALWVFNFSADWTKMLFLNKQLSDSQENLKRLKEARDLLPDYLRMKLGEDDNGRLTEFTNNVNTVTNAHHNEIITKASARNPHQADALGRGLTLSWIWIDEIAFLAFNRIIYSAMAPAFSKASEVAREQGKPTAILLTTTPGDLACDHGLFAHSIKEDAGQFDETLYDMDSEELPTWMDKNSKNGFLYIEFRYQQLSHKDPQKWFNEQCKGMLFDWPKIRREILLQWSSSASNSPFDLDDLSDLRDKALEPDESLAIKINKYYTLNVYRELITEDKYIITVDPAKGRGKKADRTAIVVTNARTNKVHAIFKSNVIQYKETYRFLYTLVYKYIPNSVIIVENNIGDAIIEYLLESPMKHMVYYEFQQNVTKDRRKDGVKQSKSKNSIVYGVNTNAQNRPKYFDILFEYVHSEQERLNCIEMVEEIERLEYKTSTRIEAISGGDSHDDIIMSYLMGQYIMHYGNNRARFGLFFSEMIDSSRTESLSSVFDTDINIFDKKREMMYESPFLTDLLVKPETFEELEKKWAKGYRNKYEEDDVFGGTKDSFGINTIDEDAFFTLNTPSKNDRDTFIDDDTFGTYNDPILDDDDGEGSFF